MKKILILLFCSLCGFTSIAQETAKKTFWEDPIGHPLAPFYLVMAFVGIVIITLLVVMLYLTRMLNTLVKQSEKERALKLGKAYVPRESWLSKTWQQLNASVPVEQERDIDMGHSFDGIRELDNHLPPWWKWLFYIT